jgi:hypothetical protein
MPASHLNMPDAGRKKVQSEVKILEDVSEDFNQILSAVNSSRLLPNFKVHDAFSLRKQTLSLDKQLKNPR